MKKIALLLVLLSACKKAPEPSPTTHGKCSALTFVDGKANTLRCAWDGNWWDCGMQTAQGPLYGKMACWRKEMIVGERAIP